MYNSRNRIKAAREHGKKVQDAMYRRMIDKSYDPVIKSIYDVKQKKEKG